MRPRLAALTLTVAMVATGSAVAVAAEHGTRSPRLAVARDLQLTPDQRVHIRAIIDRGWVNGRTTVATQHEVLRVLTAEQRNALRHLVPPPPKP
jgi:Spy/CpxP family protein refolding chaperone